ncbi:MAG: FliA/WhiG family RNA polymerase sigma factor [Oscillospiraceae bacterium]|nr:FliA/WhiG family RNA polymerase sigma factor [Oscillospiraceae bacterium]
MTDKTPLSEEEFNDLHSKYMATKDMGIRNKLIMLYSYIPKTVAFQLRGVTAGYAQLEDMVNQGILVLIDCIEKFDPERNIKFESYAFMRIRGGVIDFVRKQDWIPRRVRAMAKEISDSRAELCSRLKREPTEAELAAKMEIPVEKLRQYSYESASAVTFSFEELLQNVSNAGELMVMSSNDSAMPENMLMKNELRRMLKTAIENLEERERLVLTLYYFENLTLSDISKVIEVSIQRVSQINARAVSKLRKCLVDYIDV